jgi:hypothetical protein
MTKPEHYFLLYFLLYLLALLGLIIFLILFLAVLGWLRNRNKKRRIS